MAAVATGTPITTHTDGVLGPEQLRILGETGCPPHRVIVGHSCGNPDPAYHRAIVDAGAYIGFDRFGLTMIRLDEGRIDSLLTLVRAGEIGRVIISHDSPWCLRGSIWSGEALRTFTDLSPMHFSRNIVPRLKQFGMDDSHFDALLIDNPRNYFSGLS